MTLLSGVGFSSGASNNAPVFDTSEGPVPIDGAFAVSTSRSLSVFFTDADDNAMEVAFYDASDNSPVGTDSDVESGDKASVVWSGLADNTLYSWYAEADDGVDVTQTPTWSFTTEENLPIDDAVDSTGFTWSSGGDAGWTGQTSGAYHDNDVARSEYVHDEENAYLETTVDGVGDLSFYWRASSEDGYDKLMFFLDGVNQDNTSGEDSWKQRTYEIPPGTHSVRWTYSKDKSRSEDDDCGYLDLVEFQPNRSPNVPESPSPSDGGVGVSVNPPLSVDVSDPDNDPLNVFFYDNSDGSLIENVWVDSGENARIEWSNLSYNTWYSWYAVADDGYENSAGSN